MATLATVFFERWVNNFGIPTKVLIDNGPPFTSKFLATICTQQSVETITTTSYHPESNGQVKRFKQTVVSRLRYYVTGHRKDWDALVIPLTYACNAQDRKEAELLPFRLVLNRKPLGPVTICLSTVAGTPDANSAWSQHLRLLQKASLLRKMTNTKLRQSHETHKENQDKRVRFEAALAPSDSVFIEWPQLSASSAERLVGKRHKILLPQRLGTCRMINVGPEYVDIRHDGIENTVSINHITRAPRADEEQNNDVTDETKKANSNKQPRERRETPKHYYTVEWIVNHEKTKNRIRYRVQCYGYKPTDDTYEPTSNIRTRFIHRYWERELKQKDNCKSSRRTNGRLQINDNYFTKKNNFGTRRRSRPLHSPALYYIYGENDHRLRVHEVHRGCPNPNNNFIVNSSLPSGSTEKTVGHRPRVHKVLRGPSSAKISFLVDSSLLSASSRTTVQYRLSVRQALRGGSRLNGIYDTDSSFRKPGENHGYRWSWASSRRVRRAIRVPRSPNSITNSTPVR